MVSALDSGASSPDSSPGQGHCILFLGKVPKFPSLQGVKLTFFTGSHLAPKYFKLVANSKRLVVKIHTSYKEDTRMQGCQ